MRIIRAARADLRVQDVQVIRLKRVFWRAIRAGVLVIAVLIAIPVVLVPVYAVINPVSVPMLTRTLTGQSVARTWQPIDAISDRLKASVVMSEDGQFCRHLGIDVTALRAEFEAWRAGDTPRGASTITMQVARNLFLWNGRSYVRKALEVPLAAYLDLVLSKRRIMEIYLNIAEWGPNGEFGVAAGAAAAFGTDADAFSWERASLMVTALPNPHVRLPARPTRGLQRVAGIIERRARAVGNRIDCLYKSGERPDL